MNVMLHGTRDSAEDLLRRVRGEFLEMPGLRLTLSQARRLWGIDSGECERILARLVDKGFLFRTKEGAYLRMSDSPRHE